MTVSEAAGFSARRASATGSAAWSIPSPCRAVISSTSPRALGRSLEDFFAGDLQLQPRISTKPWDEVGDGWKQPRWSKLVSDCSRPDHPPTSPQLSVIVPAYNEAATIARGRAASRCRAGGAAASYEVIVVSGREHRRDARNRQAARPACRRRRGLSGQPGCKGSAIMAGAEAARAASSGSSTATSDIHPSGLAAG